MARVVAQSCKYALDYMMANIKLTKVYCAIQGTRDMEIEI